MWSFILKAQPVLNRLVAIHHRLWGFADAIAEVNFPELGCTDECLLLFYPSTHLERQFRRPGERVVGHLHSWVGPKQFQKAVDRIVGGFSITAAQLTSPLESPLRDFEA